MAVLFNIAVVFSPFLRNLTVGFLRYVQSLTGFYRLPLKLFNSWQRVAHAVFASRSLINLRKTNATRHPSVELPSLSLTTLEFHGPRRSESSRRFTERLGEDIETWFAPDPELFCSDTGSIPTALCNDVAPDARIREKLSIQLEQSDLTEDAAATM